MDPREKYETYENYLFFVVTTCDHNMASPTFLEPSNLFIIMFSDFVLTIHEKPMEQHIRGVFRLIDRSNVFITSDWVMYALLDHIVDGFMANRKPMELEVDAIDDLVLILTENDQPDMLRRIGIARKRVTQMFRYLHPKIEIIKSLAKRNDSKLSHNTILYLRDTQDHVLTMTQNLEHLAETLNRSHSNYLAQISIEITQASNRMNVVVKKLSVWAAVFVPLTLLSGIWGMNVPVPGEKDVHWYELGPFLALILTMILIAAIIIFGAKRFKMY
jgi:Mg2+ and Co2+ transporter CorA